MIPSTILSLRVAFENFFLGLATFAERGGGRIEMRIVKGVAEPPESVEKPIVETQRCLLLFE
jgi:hypothetical protein